MDNIKDYRDNLLSDNSMIPISIQPVKILLTEDDKVGREISKMSNFMEVFAKTQVATLRDSHLMEIVSNMPIADIGVINSVLSNLNVFTKDHYNLVPDFGNLPEGIRDKLKKGIYKLGESRQVDGNLRPVVLDENGVRVKDVTLKKVIDRLTTGEAIGSVINQLQMKQITDRLEEIQTIQSYQLDKDRDHQLFSPFYDARDFILYAQNSKTIDERNHYLGKASEKLTTVKNELYKELETAAKHLAKKSKHPFFAKQSTISLFTSHMGEDLQFVTLVCGLKMQVFEYLGQHQNSLLELKQYKTFMWDYLTKEISESGYTAIELLHDNYRYTKKNLDSWYNISIELKTSLSDLQDEQFIGETFILSLEDAKDGE